MFPLLSSHLGIKNHITKFGRMKPPATQAITHPFNSRCHFNKLIYIFTNNSGSLVSKSINRIKTFDYLNYIHTWASTLMFSAIGYIIFKKFQMKYLLIFKWNRTAANKTAELQKSSKTFLWEEILGMVCIHRNVQTDTHTQMFDTLPNDECFSFSIFRLLHTLS